MGELAAELGRASELNRGTIPTGEATQEGTDLGLERISEEETKVFRCRQQTCQLKDLVDGKPRRALDGQLSHLPELTPARPSTRVTINRSSCTDHSQPMPESYPQREHACSRVESLHATDAEQGDREPGRTTVQRQKAQERRE